MIHIAIEAKSCQLEDLNKNMEPRNSYSKQANCFSIHSKYLLSMDPAFHIHKRMHLPSPSLCDKQTQATTSYQRQKHEEILFGLNLLNNAHLYFLFLKRYNLTNIIVIQYK